MPYRIERRGEQYCVVKISDDSTAGCHRSRVRAERQRRALHAAEAEESERSAQQADLARALLGVVLDLHPGDFPEGSDPP